MLRRRRIRQIIRPLLERLPDLSVAFQIARCPREIDKQPAGRQQFPPAGGRALLRDL